MRGRVRAGLAGPDCEAYDKEIHAGDDDVRCSQVHEPIGSTVA